MSNIKVFENSDKPIFLRVRERNQDGTTTPYIFVNVDDIQLFVKKAKADDDAHAKFEYTLQGTRIVVTADGSAPGATYSEIEISPVAADQVPGDYYFYIVVLRLGKREVIGAGIWHVENI